MLKIGQVARRTGLSVEAIRYYQRLGLIAEASRTASGYRQFAPGVVRRLEFVRRAQALGFSLEEIRELLELRLRPGARPPRFGGRPRRSWSTSGRRSPTSTGCERRWRR